MTMYTTAGGIDYELLGGYPKLKAKQQHFEASEVVLVDLADADAFLNESFPAPIVIGGVYYFPARRTNPNYSMLFTEEIDVEPFPSDLLPGDGQHL